MHKSPHTQPYKHAFTKEIFTNSLWLPMFDMPEMKPWQCPRSLLSRVLEGGERKWEGKRKDWQMINALRRIKQLTTKIEWVGQREQWDGWSLRWHLKASVLGRSGNGFPSWKQGPFCWGTSVVEMQGAQGSVIVNMWDSKEGRRPTTKPELGVMGRHWRVLSGRVIRLDLHYIDHWLLGEEWITEVRESRLRVQC